MKITEFIPTAGRIILKKTRELTRVVDIEKPDYENAIVENPEKQDSNDLETPPPVVPTKTVREKATMGVQIGEIAAINNKDALAHGLRKGDKVAYGIHTLKEFDLIKGKYGLLDVYNILGLVTDRGNPIVPQATETYMDVPEIDPSFLGTDLRAGAYDK